MEKEPANNPELLWEELETLSALHRSCELVFRSPDGARTVVRDRVGKLYIQDGRKWLRTAGGIPIPLEDLMEIDGIRISKNC